MKGSPFLLKQDGSTDVSKAALVLFFVRYHWSGILQEDMLFCGELPTRTTAQGGIRRSSLSGLAS